MTYEYACSACGHEWEAEQSIREAPLKKCPKCGKLQAKRMISRGAGFILKGGGWYADGYGSSKGKSGDGGEKASPKAADGGEKAASKTEDKGGGDKGGGSSSGSGESSSKTATA
jgi:putative FmdB family regulatory protein